jgi:16S rRNA (cytidine1402-2'-O)-methyltransferase
MDTPYRLVSLLQDLAGAFGDSRRLCIAYNLTLPDEKIFRGNAQQLFRQFSAQPQKGEFVIVIEGHADKV